MSTHSSTSRRRRAANHKRSSSAREQRPTLSVAANPPATPQPASAAPAPLRVTPQLQFAGTSSASGQRGGQRSLADADGAESTPSFAMQWPEAFAPSASAAPQVTIRRRTDAPRTIDQYPATWSTDSFMAASARRAAPAPQQPLVAAIRQFVSRRSAFSPTERDWRYTRWGRHTRLVPGVIAGLAALLIILTLSFALAIRTGNSKQAQQLSQVTNVQAHNSRTGPGGIIVKQPSANGQPTPVAAPYDIGAWVSDNTPPASGTVRVYARISQGSKPVANVPVTLSVRFAYSTTLLGPQTTDADGLVTFTVSYSNAPKNTPVFATAFATVGSQSLSHQATFFPH